MGTLDSINTGEGQFRIDLPVVEAPGELEILVDAFGH